ncbi:MAG: cofactor assembly of complex C subunit B [Synechococcaceae cyanobacterium SM2_3_1]|nr:cofactor assembly of complex C subunit B [Synechococcaceae cyanobacterium SM2_3_1]
MRIAVAGLTPTSVTTSTLLMTLLLAVGLFFFLRASGKDRTEMRLYRSSASLQELGARVQGYFHNRCYHLKDLNSEGWASFQGQGQPSRFLTVYLTTLAAVGLACLSTVLQSLHPDWQRFPWLLLLIAPLAGWYYRRRSQRTETVKVRIKESEDPTIAEIQLQIVGHRDELDTLEQQFNLDPLQG